MSIASLTASIGDLVIDAAQEAPDRLQCNQELLRVGESWASLARYRSILLGPEPSAEVSHAPPTFRAERIDVGPPARRKIGF